MGWGQWQGTGSQEAPVPVSTTTATVNHAQNHANPTHPAHPPQQELSDMLQILGQSEPSSFGVEELSMFNSFQE